MSLSRKIPSTHPHPLDQLDPHGARIPLQVAEQAAGEVLSKHLPGPDEPNVVRQSTAVAELREGHLEALERAGSVREREQEFTVE